MSLGILRQAVDEWTRESDDRLIVAFAHERAESREACRPEGLAEVLGRPPSVGDCDLFVEAFELRKRELARER